MADTQPAEELAAERTDQEASTPDDAAPPPEDPPPVTEEAAENGQQVTPDKAYPWETTRPAEITPPVSPPVSAEANAPTEVAAPAADVTEPSKVDPKSWAVDTSYIDYRTADPDRLESRRAAGDVAEEGATAGLPAANVVTTTTAKDEDGKYKVDTSYINHRTADPDNLEVRRNAADGAEEGAPGAGMPASAAVTGATAKDEDGKYKVDTSYINHRTADPNNLESRRAAETAEDGALTAGLPSSGPVVGATAKDEDGKYKVDTSYINHRTADPNRLESRRSVAGAAEEAAIGLPTADVCIGATAKDEDGKYKVDTSYINHRTADPNNLESRRGADVVEEGTAAACLPTTGVFAGTAAKDEDGKWKEVKTSYINHRTADPERLEGRRDKDTEDKPSVASATVKKEADGKWNVDTSYIDYRTTDPNRLEPRRGASEHVDDPAQNTELNLPSAPSATVKKEADGTWKVDTSYIGYRTGDPNNLTRKEEESKGGQKYSDPAEKKYTYEEIKGIGTRPTDVDPERKELYLSEDEFKAVFEMGSAEFAKFPKWKRQNIKKSKDLF